MKNYILRIRPYDTAYDAARGITQQAHFAKVTSRYLEEYLQGICVWSLMQLSDGTILCVFEQSASNYLPEYLRDEFDVLYKNTDGYQLEVCEDIS